ncbi:hypothetical protein Patl1_00088 [Pistacia atlantica]|uniref:Uncharacterized protein n=1 Tax=Pistacia atlantica TaxID=434234 RepID=A0ACC1CBQ2_9ROSI|nr:hypothetical protein Patl1_00088 [Pistacia atlantica]
MPKPTTISSGRSWFKYFQYEEGRDSPAEARNVILVVVTLIAAVTFQSGVNIPGGVWQDEDDGHAPGFPFHFEIWVATAAMLVTYASTLYAVTPDDSVNLIYVLVASALPFVIRCLIHLFNKCITRFKSKSNIRTGEAQTPSP